MKVNQMNNKLKFILNKIIAAANDDVEINTIDYFANPVSQETNLTLFLGKWIPKYVLDVGLNIDLDDDATIIVPDLDAPTNIPEYLDWLNYKSVCKIRGEGEFLETIVGFKLYAKLHGWLGSEPDTVREEPPIPLMEGNNSFSTRYITAPSASNVKEILESAGRSINDLNGLSAVRLRMFICSLNFPNKNAEESKLLKGQLIKELYTGTVVLITQIGYSGNFNHIGFTPKKINGVIVGNVIPVASPPEAPSAEESTCGALWAAIPFANISIDVINSVNAIINRRTVELLKRQAFLYYSLIQNQQTCRDPSLSLEERALCLACGNIPFPPAPPPPPKPPIEPLGVGCTDPLTCPDYESIAPDIFREHYYRERRNP